MADLFTTGLRVRALPLIKGQDLIVEFKRIDPADGVSPISYDAGTTVTLVIETKPDPITGEGIVTDDTAVCRIESSDVDSVKAGVFWHLLVSVPFSETETTDIVPVNGKIVRYDGAKAPA